MSPYSLSHLSDPVLLRELSSVVAKERGTTAQVLAHLAEVDARKLYLPAAHPSMYSYCVHELRLSEDAAAKRIQAARLARRFPAIFSLLADGRLHLTGAGLLAPHLTEANAEELLAAAVHRTKAQIEQLLAERFPSSELLAWVQPVVAPAGRAEHAPAHVERSIGEHAPAHVEPPTPPAKVAPLAPERYALQVTISRQTQQKLEYAKSLLGPERSELADVLDRALDTLIHQLERRKFAATEKPRPRRHHGKANPRHIPATIKREVWRRDQGQCTFVSESGQRCPACTRLEFDHVEPVARGGSATIGGLRLRCRAHNQFTAERTYGADFMRHKREQARQAARRS